MKNLLLCTICLFTLLSIIPQKAGAQYLAFLNKKLEIGLNLGPSNFLGDLGGNKGIGKTFLKDNNIELTKIISGAFIAYYPEEWIGFRLSGHLTRIEGDDAIIKKKGSEEINRYNRNLNFRSNIAEVYIAAEFFPTVFFESDDYLQGKFRPMLLGGIGMFKFNPQTKLNGQWIDLRPLHTEGQGFPQYPNRKVYGNTAYCFPVGLGFKYYVSETFTVGMEAIHRFTTTDYIDDVSTNYVDPASFDANLPAAQASIAKQLFNRSLPGTYSDPALPNNVGKIRGDHTENDGYYSVAIKLGWRLGSEEQSEFRRARRQTRCYY
jgi:hypothetical protein